MRKFFIFVSFFCVFQTFAQHDLKFGISASSIIDFDFQQIFEYKKSYTAINSYYPFKLGLDLNYQVKPNFSIITGYSFLYRYMEVNLYTTTVGDYFYGYKMFTSEIPLLIRYDGILKNNNFSLFCELGGSLDFMYSQQSVFGGYREVLDFIVVAKWGYFYTMNLPLIATPAIQGGFGFQNKFENNHGILQVGINYHYQILKDISNEFDYYYDSGLGEFAKEDWNFFTRSTYLALDLKYYPPLKRKLKGSEKIKQE